MTSLLDAHWNNAAGIPDPRKGAVDITSLVSKIVLFPGDTRGEVHATLDCALMGILDFVGGAMDRVDRGLAIFGLDRRQLLVRAEVGAFTTGGKRRGDS